MTRIIQSLKRLFFTAAIFTGAANLMAANQNPITILFFGDSITAGYGVEPEESYPSLIQEKLDSEGIAARVVNAGVSGDTTSSGLGRLDWILKQPVDIFVLALGGNDGLRGVPPQTTKENLSKIIDLVQKKYPKATVVLAGFKMPPNYGIAYTKEFESIYTSLAKDKKVEFIPHLLKGVGGDPNLNLPDRIHPTAEGQEIIAETAWETLQPILE